jgi:hypothetical protein
MGIFSKVREIFEKKPIESFKQFEEELSKLKDKNRYEIISLIGIGGRVKGLPLIYATDDDTSLKVYSAKLNELFNMIQNLSDEKIFRDFTVNYDDSILFFKPIMSNIGFFAIINNKNDIMIIKQFIYNNEKLLRELFHEES